ncbi:unnamed protein product [Closterium sp. Naga37s-1]|nr:unnamed protein product [Closterium sp. Naga37s-1]
MHWPAATSPVLLASPINPHLPFPLFCDPAHAHACSYLSCLPQSFDSPLWFDQATLEELRGHVGGAARHSSRANLRRVYEEQVEPIFAAVRANLRRVYEEQVEPIFAAVRANLRRVYEEQVEPIFAAVRANLRRVYEEQVEPIFAAVRANLRRVYEEQVEPIFAAVRANLRRVYEEQVEPIFAAVRANLRRVYEEQVEPIFAAVRANLRRVYKEQVEPIFAAVVAEAEGEQGSGDASCCISLDDFLWANSIFWSRALTLPLTPCLSAYTNDIAADADAGAAVADADRAADDAGGADAASSPSHCLEAIVPGVDFCNHSLLPCARWEILTADQLTRSNGKNGSGEEDRGKGQDTGRGDGAVAGSASVAQPLQQMPDSDAVCLLQVVPPVGGNEVTISYGEKGNEELLFLYGFAIRNNPHECLMLNYPPAQLQEDPCADTKLQLLAVQDLSLQWIIPRSSKYPNDHLQYGGASSARTRKEQGQEERQRQEETQGQEDKKDQEETLGQEENQGQEEKLGQEKRQGQQVLQHKQVQHGQQNEEEGEGEQEESDHGGVFPPGMMAALRVLSLTVAQVEAATSALLEVRVADVEYSMHMPHARDAVREAAGGDAQALLLCCNSDKTTHHHPSTSLPFLPTSQRKAALGAGCLSPADAGEAVREAARGDAQALLLLLQQRQSHPSPPIYIPSLPPYITAEGRSRGGDSEPSRCQGGSERGSWGGWTGATAAATAAAATVRARGSGMESGGIRHES